MQHNIFCTGFSFDNVAAGRDFLNLEKAVVR
jgi:hypothetical protein